MRVVRTTVVFSLFMFATSPCLAQSPYAGQETRTIKALSTQDIVAFESGHGMGFAKVAELNHYPGPKHVLELAEQLELDPGQRAEARAAYDRMHERAVRLGKRIVARERELDALFQTQRAREEAVHELLKEIAELEGELRFTHVRAHLTMRDVLTTEQIARYDRLRGYVVLDSD